MNNKRLEQWIKDALSNSEYKIIVCLDEFENVVNENDIEIFFKPNIYQIFNGNLSRDIKL